MAAGASVSSTPWNLHLRARARTERSRANVIIFQASRTKTGRERDSRKERRRSKGRNRVMKEYYTIVGSRSMMYQSRKWHRETFKPGWICCSSLLTGIRSTFEPHCAWGNNTFPFLYFFRYPVCDYMANFIFCFLISCFRCW